MDPRTAQTVFAIQSAIMEVLETVESITLEPERREKLRIDAEQTILKMIAAIVLADGACSSQEKEILCVLIKAGENPVENTRFLNEYAARWNETRKLVPEFFRDTVEHDRTSGAEVSRSVIRELQLIGNNVSICSGRTNRSSLKIVQEFVGFLNAFIDQPR